MFFDRYDAGERLAEKLHAYQDTGSVVCALPRGGVPVGYQIAKRLHVPLDIVITRKIGHPLNREVAICAVTEDGRRVCDDGGLYGLGEAWIEHESIVAREEALRRRKVFGPGVGRSLEGKTIIVVDDGIATGLSMKAAIVMLRSQHPQKLILAVPVCPEEVGKELLTEVDEMIVLDQSKTFRGSVGAYYTHFPEVSDEEVIACLEHDKLSPETPDPINSLT